ncbi:MAG: FAA hydrolase family protein [Alphaproteobacteria bacterium]|nr:MAG: FAA hydrolase family protein [Alphaproteobacteria bacterium]
MDYVIPAWDLPSVAVAGEQRRFPVHRIYCVGRNYAEHAREMGKDPSREPPFFFMKPADAVVDDGGLVPYPPATTDLHHEVELVVALGRGGTDIAAEDARAYIYGYAVGIDLTRRDLQQVAKDRSWPWDTAKGFDHGAPCGAIHPVAEIGHPTHGAITLSADDELRQQGDLADMIWSVPEIIAHLSRLFTLHPGDLIYTGTPAGVGSVTPVTRLHGEIEGVGSLSVTVVDGI